MKLLLALVAALALAGCGAEARTSSAENFPAGAERDVAQKVEDLQEAGERNEPDDICSNILSQALVRELEAAGVECADEMKKAIEDADDYELDVRDVNVSGNTATVRVQRGEDGPAETMEFTRENGDWRATSLSG
jgi:hypothetical protein